MRHRQVVVAGGERNRRGADDGSASVVGGTCALFAHLCRLDAHRLRDAHTPLCESPTPRGTV